MRARARHRLVYLLGRGAIGLCARLPQWLGYGAAAGLGQLYFRCSRRRRQCALRLLRAAFPDRSERELLRIGRVSTGNVFKVPIDMARLTRLLGRGGDPRTVVDVGAAAGSLPQGQFLGASAHLGSWEVAAAAMARTLGGIDAIARTFRNPLLQRWILRNRERSGLRIHARRGGVRALARVVARGGIAMQIVDQHQRLRGVRATFFGREASCERALCSLALRRGLPIAVGAAVRTGRGFRFRMVFEEPFVPARTGERERDLRAAVEELNRRLEAMIRAWPEQYLWIHDRYREPVAGRPGRTPAAL